MPDTTRWAVLDSSLTALKLATADLTTEQLNRATPCEQWSVGQVLEHAALDQLAWANAVTSGAVAGPTANPFEPSGSPPESVVPQVHNAVAIADAAWSGLGETQDLATPLPQGPMKPDAAAAACALDAAVHAWDVAAALGRLSSLSDDLAAQLAPVAHEIVEPLRAWGAFAAALPDSGGPAESLLRYLGRDPDWSS